MTSHVGRPSNTRGETNESHPLSRLDASGLCSRATEEKIERTLVVPCRATSGFEPEMSSYCSVNVFFCLKKEFYQGSLPRRINRNTGEMTSATAARCPKKLG